ncbi:hypothetical protein O6H91_15G008700 [Diphasiastrum complanatum]|uniref:Uncharacterized protein n=1 Tax=Diphasiastrum complanatum TaxID=34168 RepID=A0ACC2BFP2_DIPCM|nr:hypothetical protein O6H91_15G008700 [Diphasiastrum complanatum]
MKSLHKRVAPSSSVEILSSELLPLNLPTKKRRLHDIFPRRVDYEGSHLAFGKNFQKLLGTGAHCLGDGAVSRFGSFEGKHSFRPNTSDRAMAVVEVEGKQDFEERASLLEVPIVKMCKSLVDKGPMYSGQYVKLFSQLSNVEYDGPSGNIVGKQATVNFKPSIQSVKALTPSELCSKNPSSETVQRNTKTISYVEPSSASRSSQAFSSRQGKRLQGSGNLERMRLGHTSDRNIEKIFKSGCGTIAEVVNLSGRYSPLIAQSKTSVAENDLSQYRSTPVGSLDIELVLDPEGGIKERSLQLACSSSGGIVQRTEKILKVESCLNFLEQFGVFKSSDKLVPRVICAAATRPGIVGDGVITQNCRICGKPEDAVGTLICDACEQVFHVACCQPKARTLPRDDRWTCSFCRRKDKRIKKKGSKSLESCLLEGSLGVGVWRGEGYPTSCAWDVCQFRGQYRTQVRIGVKYQAEVPEWTGKDDQPLLEANVIEDYPGMEIPLSLAEKIREKELAEKNLVNNIWPKGWLPATCLPGGSRENWLQCQHVLYEEGQVCPDGTMAVTDIICGKWRRAPLEVEAVEGWECSWALVWDPRHADCVVPQELPTEEIEKRQMSNQVQIEVWL